MAIGGTELQKREALALAMAYSQLAAAYGGLDALQRLAAVQIFRAERAQADGDEWLAVGLHAKALANLNLAANNGSELAGQVINDLGERVDVTVFERARAMEDR